MTASPHPTDLLVRELIASVRRDVVSLTARPAVQERSSFQTIRPLHNQRANDTHATSSDADKHDAD